MVVWAVEIETGERRNRIETYNQDTLVPLENLPVSDYYSCKRSVHETGVQLWRKEYELIGGEDLGAGAKAEVK